ncbi:MAG TPA: hypothetical protein VIG85_06900 [Comamonas sp.]
MSSSFSFFVRSMASKPARGARANVFTPRVKDDVSALTSDIHMRLVSELENDYWHAHFSRESYYVQGRGYDQYQPAYQLGWKYALQHPDASFQDFAQEMESDWIHQRSSSLLPWREVEGAVRQAWEHANVQMHKLQHAVPTVLQGREMELVLQPLYKGCVRLLAEMQCMRVAPMHDFAGQVLDRHMHLIQHFMAELDPFVGDDARIASSGAPWPRKLTSRWFKFQPNFSDCASTEVFDQCELRERRLLSAYQRAQHKNLPADVKDIVQRHAKQLSMNLDKLIWVRKNWMV